MAVMTERKASVVSADATFSARIYVVDGPPDADGDVIARGAIEDGHKVRVSLAEHDTTLDPGLEPVGEAELHHVGGAVHAFGRVFDTPRGARLRSKLLDIGPNQQWSIGYRVLEWRPPTAEELAQYPDIRRVILKWDPDEISPVRLGACGPTCRTLDAKCAGDCADCAQRAEREAALKEMARFEIARGALILSNARTALREVDRDLATLEQCELKVHQVAAPIRAAAADAVELAAEILGGEPPRIRWYAATVIPEVKANGVHFAGVREVWLAARDDAGAVYETAAHEAFHALSATGDEAAARRFGNLLGVLRGVELHVGPQVKFVGELVPVYPGHPERVRRGALPDGALVVDNGIVYRRESGAPDGWRRVAALTA